MGFFGFLKREPLRAPEMPAVQASSAALPPATPDLYGEEIPPPPPSDAFLFDTKPWEVIIHDEVHHDADLDLLPKESPREPAPELSEPEPATKAAELAPTPPPVHLELQTPAPRPQQEPKAREDWTSFPAPTAPMAQSLAEEGRREPPFDLPDFTDEEISAAEQMMRRRQEEREREREMEREKEEEEKEETESEAVRERPEPIPILPPPMPDAFYVPVHVYRESLAVIGSLKASLKRGDAALSQMGVSMSSHTQSFAAFADEVNAVQESLMQMDNIMISQR